MGLPLPSVVADTGPGGGLVTAMGGINALNNAMLLKQINAVKAQYAPATTMAEAASKMAYANLMGPQFLAKLMGNDSALANMSEDQKRNALQTAYRAGTGQGTGNAFLNNSMANGVGQPSTNALSGWIKNKLQNAFGQTPSTAPSQTSNPIANNNGQMASNNGQPNSMSSLAAIAQYYKSPQGQQEMTKEGYPNGYPSANQLTLGQPTVSTNQAQPAPTYAQNTGAYKGTVAQGEEAGKIRAKNINDLNQTVFKANTTLGTLDQLRQILTSPVMAPLRQVPLAGRHELEYYAKEGTPAQQQMVGRYNDITKALIKSYARDFGGQFRSGEQHLLNQMTADQGDTIDAAIGKTEALTTLTQMIRDRSSGTSQLMNQHQMDQLPAENIVEKHLNADQIRQSIHDKLNPTITIRNKKTGETKTIPIAQARQLGVPNV